MKCIWKAVCFLLTLAMVMETVPFLAVSTEATEPMAETGTMVQIDREYVILKIGETVQLTARVQPSELGDSIQWRVECEQEDFGSDEVGSDGGDIDLSDNVQPIISVDQNGLVTACSIGTAYVVASVTDGNTTKSACCRVDVIEDCGDKGDLNEDGNVDSRDAVYLLWHVLLPEEHPLVGNGDVTGDGEVTVDDAIYLIWHTLFPSVYPLQ